MTSVNGFKHSCSDHIQVVHPNLDVNSVIKKITQSGNQEDGFYICNVSDIIRKYKEWKMIMPRIETHYAVKCNDSKVVLEVLASLGIGFDCASEAEIVKVLSLGVEPNRIIFANPTKKISQLKVTAKMGVDLLTFDSENELYKIKTYQPTAKLVIRIKCDDITANYVFGQKYGCDPETEALELLLSAYNLNLNVIGVSFHIGSGSRNFSIYSKAIAISRSVFDIAARVGYNFTLLDIGGGFPGETGTSVKEIGDIINAALEKHFPDLSVRVISEPGRYYVNSAFTLASNIISVKCVVDAAKENKIKMFMYYVDVSVYGALIPVIFKEYFTTKALKISEEEAKLFPCIVWGPTCDTYDKISETTIMLPKMNVGDWVLFEDTGAYTLSISCEFNGIPTPKIHSIIDKDNWLLLTEKAPFPISKDKFVSGNTLDDFRTGLTSSNYFRTNYFY